MKKLIIFDLNGVLIKKCAKCVIVRPYLLEFINYCLKNFKVGIWSSRPYRGICQIIEDIINQKKLTQEQINQFLFIKGKGIHKDLRHIWKLYPQYNENNTLLLDNTISKINMNPEKSFIHLKTWNMKDIEDNNALNENGYIRQLIENWL
jgi:hydroxymethylpyrimidine pyrophosphatase-like HAD family hydrolase